MVNRNKMKILQIITPCSRPQNLQKIKENIEQIVTVTYDWYIIFDDKTDMINIISDNVKVFKNNQSGNFGNKERNIGLKYKDDYKFVYFLDDDNLLHDNFMELFNYIDEISDIYVFNQENRLQSGTNKVCSENQIDTACFLIKSSIIKNNEWNPTIYAADARFIADLQYRSVVKFIPKTFCKYNALR